MKLYHCIAAASRQTGLGLETSNVHTTVHAENKDAARALTYGHMSGLGYAREHVKLIVVIGKEDFE